jgi:hypothetical protein
MLLLINSSFADAGGAAAFAALVEDAWLDFPPEAQAPSRSMSTQPVSMVAILFFVWFIIKTSLFCSHVQQDCPDKHTLPEKPWMP